MHIRTHFHTHIHAHTHARTHAHTQMHARARARARTHTHTHTHTPDNGDGDEAGIPARQIAHSGNKAKQCRRMAESSDDQSEPRRAALILPANGTSQLAMHLHP